MQADPTQLLLTALPLPIDPQVDVEPDTRSLLLDPDGQPRLRGGETEDVQNGVEACAVEAVGQALMPLRELPRGLDAGTDQGQAEPCEAAGALASAITVAASLRALYPSRPLDWRMLATTSNCGVELRLDFRHSLTDPGA